MKRQEVAQKILEQLNVNIRDGQWGLVGRIYDLKKQGFEVKIIHPKHSWEIEEYEKMHRGCNLFFEIRNDDFQISSSYNRERITSYLEKGGIKNPEKIENSGGALERAWFFEKQGICGYFLGDDIPF